MHRGNMILPVFEHGKPVDIHIKEGEWFLLPGHIPHSPQRPEKESRGLVIERERALDEIDALRYYTSDQSNILWEEWFHCYDLGVQLKPVINAYFASEQYKTGVPIPGDHLNPSPPYDIDRVTTLERPVKFNDWLKQNESLLNAQGRRLVGNESNETKVLVFGQGKTETSNVPVESLLWQFKGAATLTLAGREVALKEGDHYLVPVNTPFSVSRDSGAVGILMQMFPHKKSK